MDATESEQIQVAFVTKDARYSVDTHPVFVQLDSGRADLSDLVKSLLSREDDSSLEFEFLVQDELLVGSLRQLVQDGGQSLDSVLTAEFFVRRSAPSPHAQLSASDFVSCVRASGARLLAAVYDGTVQLATVDAQRPTASVAAHEREVKCLDWLTGDAFVSAGHDQDCRLWRWAGDTAECLGVCKGHAASVLCCCASANGQHFASGSFDGQLKVWSVEGGDLSAETGGIPHRGGGATRLPLLTLGGHKDAVHCADYCDAGDAQLLCSGSSDASLRLWDCEAGAEVSCLRAGAAVLSLHCRRRLLLAGCAATQPRLYDPRSDTDVLVASFSAHDSWVSAVRWCPTGEQLFVTASYDTVVKVWDLRCWRAPLYDIRDHSGIVASVDWTTTGHIVSAGADQTVKVFSASMGQL